MNADPGKRGGRAVGRRDAASAIVVGVDTGGTFTDLVALVGGEIRVHKVLSTPDDPARAVIEGLSAMLTGVTARVVTYSSTVATNALLEKKGARVALFTNAGFEDLIEIGRQNRTELYALAPTRPEPLVARAMRFGVAQRTLFDGTEALRLTRAELARIARVAARSGAEAFAIGLLHSYANPRAEAAIARALGAAWTSGVGVESDSPRISRIRTPLDDGSQRVRRPPDGHSSREPRAPAQGI